MLQQILIFNPDKEDGIVLVILLTEAGAIFQAPNDSRCSHQHTYQFECPRVTSEPWGSKGNSAQLTDTLAVSKAFFTYSINNKRNPCCRKPNKQRVDPTATANHRFKPCICGFSPAGSPSNGRQTTLTKPLGGLCFSCSLTALCRLEAHNNSVCMAGPNTSV